MKIFLGLIIAALIFLIYNYIQISQLYISKPVLNSPKLYSDLRLTQISDYHNNTRIDKTKLLQEIKKFNPHLILLTGDFIDSKTRDIDSAISLIKEIGAINPGIYFVIGNHEIGNKYEKEFLNKLEKIGVNILNNSNKVVDINGEKINICGVGFYINKRDYEKALEGIDRKNFTLMLTHSPNRPIDYSAGVEDLILAGHTHGGQVRLPIIGAIIVPGQGFFPKYHKGIYKLKNTILYIDSGLGNSLLPLRLFNRVQISNIVVKTIDN